MPHAMPSPSWPYPRWIAHRGAGKLAPENTLAAFKLGYQYGYRMFECDAKLSADGIPFLLHDTTLERTTNAAHALPSTSTNPPSTTASDHSFATLAQLDAGGWHSASYAGEPLPTLANILQFCGANGALLNIEIKPTLGFEAITGHAVANLTQRLWKGSTPPLLSSFDTAALASAQTAAPALPRGLLVDVWRETALQEAQSLGCTALICNYRLWNADLVAQAKALGLRTLSYTVNTAEDAQKLWGLGTDGVITDKVDILHPEVDGRCTGHPRKNI